MIANIGCELYETNVDVMGGIVRLFDVIAIAMNLGNSIFAMTLFFRYFGY